MRKPNCLSPALVALMVATSRLAAQTEPAATAHDLYLGAAALIAVHSPSASNGEFPEYPPMGEAWDKLAAAAWRQNGEAREKAREANAAPVAGWPAGKDWTYLNKIRALANELGDAAQYRGLAGDLPAAIGFANDLLDLGDKLRAPPIEDRILVHWLVAGGIDALTCYRLFVVAPEFSAAKEVPVEDVRKLIVRLLDRPDRTIVLDDVRNANTPLEPLDRVATTFARIDAERGMAAMSLACQLYRRDTGAWPATAGDLVPAYLPAVPIDSADDKTPLGYALVAKGLPDGGDRPLVYSREESKDGLAYRTDAPQYGFYVGDGSDRPTREQLRAGQFRDVARWTPTTRPVATQRPALTPIDAK